MYKRMGRGEKRQNAALPATSRPIAPSALALSRERTGASTNILTSFFNLEEIKLDPGFLDFHTWCAAQSPPIPLIIVSSGMEVRRFTWDCFSSDL